MIARGRRFALDVFGLVIAIALLAPVAAACAPRAHEAAPASEGERLATTSREELRSPGTTLAVLPASIPWPFEANGGQGPADATLLLKHDPFTAAFTSAGPRIRLVGLTADAESTQAAETGSVSESIQGHAAQRERSVATLQLELVGARSTEPVGTVPSEARISYLTGGIWAPDLPSFRQIAYREPWPGVELRYERDPRGLKSTYVVAPGADPSAIALAWRGADRVSLDEDGALDILTAAGTLRETAPIAWQDGPDGARQPVAAGWMEAEPDADGGPTWGFALGGYDPTRELVIDPLLYGSYLGGSNEEEHASDESGAVAIDSTGRAVVVGTTRSSNFGFGGAPGFDQTFGGGMAGFSGDAFVVRFNPAGTGLEYGTFLGGSGDGGDVGTGVAVDASNRAIVAGYTLSPDFSFGGAPGFDQTYAGSFGVGGAGGDAFVVRLNQAGTALEYGTFLGGTSHEEARDVAVDTSGRAVVTGFSASGDLNFGGAPGFDQAGGPGFVARLNAGGTALEYAARLRGRPTDVAVDAGDRAVVAGFVQGGGFSFGGAPGFDQNFNGGAQFASDAFVARLNAAGTALEYGTYLGGSGDENTSGVSRPVSVAMDAGGRAIVAGATRSGNFDFGGAPGFDQTRNNPPNGAADAFVVRLNLAGTGLEYGTFLGGPGDDLASGVAVDGSDRAVVVGRTSSQDFDFGGAAGFDQSFNGQTDTFLVRLSAAGTALDYGTLYGGTGTEFPRGVAVDGSGRAAFSGLSFSADVGFGGAPGFDQSFNGQGDAFVMRDTLSPGVRTVGDFDADRRSDPGIYRAANGLQFAALMAGGTKVDVFGAGADIPVAADYDADGRADFGVWTPGTARWFAVLSGGGGVNEPIGAAGQVPVPADYDGDGRADLASYNPANGAYFVKRSGGGTVAESFGPGGLIAVPADYDGDLRADLATWNPSTGQWFALLSGGGTLSVVSGTNGDIPTPADFGGDGRADLAVYRPSTGTFHVQHTNGSTTTTPVGSGNDIPVPADYDGDGRADPAVYQSASGQFVLEQSNFGPRTIPVGANGDVPLQKRPGLPGAYPYGPAPARPASAQPAPAPVPTPSPPPRPASAR